jgi:hypothetical protein
MKYLVYCIFSRNEAAGINAAPIGVGGGRPYVIGKNELGALVSAIPDGEMPKDFATILTYHKVIESFHNQFGVIPLRFGMQVDEEAEIKHLLVTQGQRFKLLLTKLDGCVEIGIRAILNELSVAQDSRNGSSVQSSANRTGTGAAYLANLKARHDAEAQSTENYKKIIGRYRSFFEGLFVGFKEESSKSTPFSAESKAILLSLHFLVRRHSVEAFREAFDQLKSRETAKLLLSGPWPPYNFVLPDDY